MKATERIWVAPATTSPAESSSVSVWHTVTSSYHFCIARYYLTDSADRTYVSTGKALNTFILINHCPTIMKTDGSLRAGVDTITATVTSGNINLNHDRTHSLYNSLLSCRVYCYLPRLPPW